MKRFFYSIAVGAGALGVSLIMIMIAVPALGDTYQKTMFVNSVLGCFLIGSPVTWYCLKQSDRLKEALETQRLLHEELVAANLLLEEKAKRDQMTGFLNRDSFLRDIKIRRKDSHVSTLLIIDADHFKSINDKFGHMMGDEALGKITEAIRDSVRQGDIVGRIGGEEFAVLLPGANQEEAMVIGERIRLAVAALVFEPKPDRAHRLSVSIGGNTAEPSTADSDLFRAADTNLYQAKNSGRNRTIISGVMKLAA